jgi:drug/metabolite transporter (DMT)-like permease
MLTLASIYWGLSFPVIKAITLLTHALVPGAGNAFLASAALAPRYLLSALLMLMFRRGGGARLTRAELGQGFAAGAFSAAGTLLQTDGLQYTDASVSSFLTQFSAILVPTWIALRHRRNPGAVVWMCCILVLAGVAILGHFDWRNLRLGRGEWETLLCSVFYTGQILSIENRAWSGNRPERVTQVMFAVQAAAFVGMAGATTPRAGALLEPWGSVPWLGLTLILTVVCTIGAFSIMTRWQPRITSTEAGLIYCTEPLFASVFALFVPALLSSWAGLGYRDERATATLVLGGAIVTFANVLVQVKSGKLVVAIEGPPRS